MGHLVSALAHFIPTTTPWRNLNIPILQMKPMRHKEAKSLVPKYTARREVEVKPGTM